MVSKSISQIRGYASDKYVSTSFFEGIINIACHHEDGVPYFFLELDHEDVEEKFYKTIALEKDEFIKLVKIITNRLELELSITNTTSKIINEDDLEIEDFIEDDYETEDDYIDTYTINFDYYNNNSLNITCETKYCQIDDEYKNDTISIKFILSTEQLSHLDKILKEFLILM